MKRIVWFFGFTYVLETIICFSILIPLLNNQSFHAALSSIHFCGIIIVLSSMVQLAIVTWWGQFWIRKYIKSLQYEIIELKDDNE